MIIFTTQPVAETMLVCLYGDLAPGDSVPMLTEHLDTLAASANLVIDLTTLGTDDSIPVEELTGHLAHAPIHRRTVVISPRPPSAPAHNRLTGRPTLNKES